MFLNPISFHRFLHPVTRWQLAIDMKEQTHNRKK